MDEAYARDRSNVENYDRAILTLSSALLGGSVTFIKEIVEPAEAVFLPLLYTAWTGLAATVVVSMLCYMYGLSTFTESTKLGLRALSHKDKDAQRKIEAQSKTTRGMTISAGVCFLVGLISLTLFVTLNIHHEAAMANKELSSTRVVERALTNAPPLTEFVAPLSQGQTTTTQTPTVQPTASGATATTEAPAAAPGTPAVE
jgi:hypothetical protein